MRINVSPFRFVLCALALSLWSAPAFSQRIERGFESETDHSSTTQSIAAEHPNVNAHHESSLTDWTHDRVLYPRIGPMDRLIALQKDPRAIQHWQESYRKDFARWRGGEGHRRLHHNRSYMHPDWAFSLGAGGVVGASFNIGVYPAKWSFDSLTVTGPADTNSCLNDYLVVPIDATNFSPGVAPFTLPPGPSQPNIIGVNNLYSGNAGLGGTGVCDRTPSTTDDGLSATTYFSYAVIGDDGIVATSPVTSVDGTKIAFVEGSTNVHFHVLAWNATDGNNDTGTGTPLGRQDALTNTLQICHQPAVAPCAGTQDFVATEPAITPGTPGHGNATDLVLGGGDSFSSPYVEYTADVAYVGNDAGQIFKIKNVFCPTWAPCLTNQAPSLDTSFGSPNGFISIGGTCANVSGIVEDGVDGNIFAGCSDGFLYEFTSTGTLVDSLQIGDGNAANGGIVDPPTVDSVNGWVYVETGSCVATLTGCTTAGDPILVQAKVGTLSTNSVADLVASGQTAGLAFNIHSPAFNDAYFTSTTPADWLLYDYAGDTTPEIVLFGITFAAGHAMNGGTPANSIGFTAPGDVEVSPVTQYLTPVVNGEDRIFASAELASSGNVVSLKINNPPTSVSVFPTGTETISPGQYGTGASGIIVDNADSTAGQANSIYFGVFAVTGTEPNANTVVKLTQIDLQ